MFTLMMPAAPKPWITRASASIGRLVAKAQPRDAIVKSARPAR